MPASNQRFISFIDDLCQGEDVFFKYIQTVRDLMTEEVHTLSLDDRLETAWELFEDHKCRHVPIIEIDEEKSEKFFVGIISHRDASRQLSAGMGTVTEDKTDERALRSSVGSIVTRNPITIGPDESIFKATELMMENKIDCLPVTNKKKDLLGLITTTDIVKTFIRISAIGKMNNGKKRGRLIDITGGKVKAGANIIIEKYLSSLEELMTEDAITLAPSEKVQDAMTIMQKNTVRHVPIVDERKGLVGIISDRDILRNLPPKANYLTRPKKVKKFREHLFDVNKNDNNTHRVLNTEVRHLMNGGSKLIVANKGDSIHQAVELMCENQIGCLPIVNGDSSHYDLLGIVTTTDILRGVTLLGMLMNQGAS